jgi:NAD(P)-dependent dehydrogenase (short-subunit alcohol dehydrogenase family)
MSTNGNRASTTGRLAGTTIMAIGCGTPDGEVNNGFAAATAFLREGARVCIVDRDPNALDEAARVLGEAVDASAPA